MLFRFHSCRLPQAVVKIPEVQTVSTAPIQFTLCVCLNTTDNRHVGVFISGGHLERGPYLGLQQQLCVQHHCLELVVGQMMLRV